MNGRTRAYAAPTWRRLDADGLLRAGGGGADLVAVAAWLVAVVVIDLLFRLRERVAGRPAAPVVRRR